MNNFKGLSKSDRLLGVNYEIRGAAAKEAERLEREGYKLLKLNTGNTGLFDFPVPEPILTEVENGLPFSQGYSTSKGIVEVRETIVDNYIKTRHFPNITEEEVFLGNGVSELISMTARALINPGDEILIPSPDYPLWTAMTSINGGKPVHYLCDEDNDWQPNIEDMASKITDKTKAILVINPNNPTGAVYSKEILLQIADIARKNSLLLLADEIYDRIIFDGIEFHSLASLAPDLLCITYNGLSKTYRVPGYRAGWMIISGPKELAKDFIEGLEFLSSARLCSNVPGQHAIHAALTEDNSIEDLISPTGRLTRQRDLTWERLNAIEGVSCVKPRGALYAFPKLDVEKFHIRDDKALVFELLKKEHILLVQGTGFNWPTPDHLRFVLLPEIEDLREALGKFATFLQEIS